MPTCSPPPTASVTHMPSHVVQLFLLRSFWCFLLLVLAAISLPVHAAEAIEVTQARLESSDDGYRLAASFSFDLNHTLEDALNRGIPLYFKIDVDITRPRWYWFDEKAIHASQTIRISYNVLTRQYHAGEAGQLQQTFANLDDVMVLLRRPNRWVVAQKDELKAGETYRVATRMSLDLAQLPKPFQVNALNNSDWRVSSDWKQFTFKADSP